MNKKKIILGTIVVVLICALCTAVTAIIFIQQANIRHLQQQAEAENGVATPSPVPSSTPMATATPTPTASAAPTATPATGMVSVYFSKAPQSNENPGATFAVERALPADSNAMFVVLNEYLRGLTASELAAGFYVASPGNAKLTVTGTSTCVSGGDYRLDVVAGRATLRFCKSVAGTGVLADARVKENLKNNLLQFPAITNVTIVDKDNHCLFDTSGEDLCFF